MREAELEMDFSIKIVPERKASSGTILDFARLPSVGQGLRILD